MTRVLLGRVLRIHHWLALHLGLPTIHLGLGIGRHWLLLLRRHLHLLVGVRLDWISLVYWLRAHWRHLGVGVVPLHHLVLRLSH